ncbi:MAG: DNA translocase FtsK [Candidatus Marinimicrobia bacterium]|nr:DNA translocase FtsK [Candidatus Neomarinimicrobiota bacterium]MBL7010348.1 DNA translocase FtsK [Candidatus Neomarinimicrobiota bacterium]MBL7030024.1 DNA translocase FtsK [Candidatus Neomarinimicrobiota bacterium]
MKERRLEILGILSVAVSLLVFISLLGYNPNEDPGISPNVRVENPMGILGVWIAYFFIKLTFGYSSFILPLLAISWGIWFFTHKEFEAISRLSGYLMGVLVLSSITLGAAQIFRYGFDDATFRFSGLVGGLISLFIYDFVGGIGIVIVLLALWLILARGYFGFSYYEPIKKLLARIQKKKEERNLVTEQQSIEDEKRRHTQSLISKIDEQRQRDEILDAPKGPESEEDNEDIIETVDEADSSEEDSTEDFEEISIVPDNISKESEEIEDEVAEESVVEKVTESPERSDKENLEVGEIVEESEVDIDSVQERKAPKKSYQLPSAELLTNPINIQGGMSRDELVERANFLQQSLETFGVVGKVVNVSPGPVITLFEVEPAEGVRVNKFVALSDDLARVMEASRVRVIAPIPGKSSVGIEIPNRNPDMVYFKSVINSEKFTSSDSMLTIAVGKTTTGEIATLDLAKMPHLLIAGTTGSGKSVCMNTILASLLYQASPDEVKFVIIDPKKVEMTLYRDLSDYHLLKIEDIDEPIVTTPDNATLALRAVEKEMGRRYDVLADNVVRNIDEYNKKMRDKGEGIMPFIVVLIDELADLMMMNAKEVEAPIARLAQLARAVGIHLVVATQRPSVDVITGIIKANFPSRIAFQVATKIDSRTIIDGPGAEKLIGRGDLLYLGSGSSEPTRLHNAFLSLEEIEALMAHVTGQPKPDELVISSPRETMGAAGLIGEDTGGFDDLFDEAVRLVVMHQQGSISLIQRRLKVGYSRAARLIDEMEQAGIVGAFTGSKAREVLVDDSYLDSLD